MKSSLFRFFTSSICFKYWTTLECLMLNSWAASHVVIKGSASMISLNWSLSPSGDWLLIFKVLVSFATTLKPPLHYTFVSSFWAKCVVDVVSCPTVLQPILNSNKKIIRICSVPSIISIVYNKYTGSNVISKKYKVRNAH